MQLFFPIIVVFVSIVVMVHHEWSRRVNRGDTGGPNGGHPQYVPPDPPENPEDIGDNV